MLKEEREKKGLSQSQLANKCDIPLSTIQKFEGGFANINHAKLETLLKLCICLECNLNDIISDDYLRVLLDTYKEENKTR